MSLQQQAVQDLCSIFQDEANGPGSPVVVTDPNGEQRRVLGIITDIGEELDPDTGVAVSGRLASCALHIRSLREAGLGMPANITSEQERPWLVEAQNSENETVNYKVRDTKPDTKLGLVVCMLEVYKP